MVERKRSNAKSAAIKVAKGDIFMSIKPEHIQNIATRAKNHEYRRYLLPSSVCRIWFYTTAPVSRLEYIARVSHGKVRGEVPEDGGIGNADFNAGKKVSKYAYEILDLWKLREPIALKQAISRGILKGPPQKYCWAPLAFLQSCPVDKQDHVLSRRPEKQLNEKPSVVKQSSQNHPEQGLDQENIDKSHTTKPQGAGQGRKISQYFAPSNR